MGWGNKRRGWWVWVLVAMCGLAASGNAAAHAAGDGNTKSAEGQGSVRFSIDREEYDAQARAAMQVDPVVAAHLGAIRKVALDDAASMDEPGPDVLVFDVEGSRGKGRVTARFITVSATQEVLGPGVLVMADGSRHEIEGDADALAAEDEAHGHDHDHDEDIEAGAGLFIRQAQEAAQRYPLVQQHIGTLQSFELDLAGTGEAEGADEFVFTLVGDKGRGRLLAEFITVDAETERLGKGMLTLADGREIAFEGEAPMEGEPDRGDAPDTFARQDGIFVLQANAAMQAHPVVQRHIGDIREAAFDRDASWAAKGDRYIFDLKGSKGAGRLEAEFITVDADNERIGDGELVMADGKRYPLDGK